MSKITLNPMFESASGKLCKKSRTYVALNKKTGKMYTAEYHDRDVVDTEKTIAVKSTFATRAQAASAWWNANKPITDANGTVTREATDDFKKLQAKYDAQSKYGNMYTLLCTYVQDDGTITIGTRRTATNTPSSTGTGTGGTTPNPNNPTEIEG